MFSDKTSQGSGRDGGKKSAHFWFTLKQSLPSCLRREAQEPVTKYTSNQTSKNILFKVVFKNWPNKFGPLFWEICRTSLTANFLEFKTLLQWDLSSRNVKKITGFLRSIGKVNFWHWPAWIKLTRENLWGKFIHTTNV